MLPILFPERKTQRSGLYENITKSLTKQRRSKYHKELCFLSKDFLVLHINFAILCVVLSGLLWTMHWPKSVTLKNILIYTLYFTYRKKKYAKIIFFGSQLRSLTKFIFHLKMCLSHTQKEGGGFYCGGSPFEKLGFAFWFHAR